MAFLADWAALVALVWAASAAAWALVTWSAAVFADCWALPA
ncbi:hypothetical protein [Streptomyces sp. 1331.2]|nr:hypothetical protein [Streptomyces sp. 1331.2]